MARKLTRRLGTFANETGDHVRALLKREESPVKAARGVSESLKKLAKGFFRAPRSAEHLAAQALLKKGIQAYNNKQYAKAEELFKQALEEEPEYARAFLYLGNTRYKMHRYTEAVAAWDHAIKSEPDSEAARAAEEKIHRMRTHRAQEMQRTLDQLQPRE